MGFSTVFKNFGHAIATAAKYTAIGLKDLVKVANKAQIVAPEVDLLVGALAGPLGVRISDLAFHALGDIATSLEKTGTDAASVQASGGLNVQMDVQTLNDIILVIPQLKAIIAALGASIPTVIKAPAAVAPPVLAPAK